MKTTLTTIIGCLLATVTCSAQWQLIDNFQQWEDGQIFTEATDIGWHSYCEREHGADEYWFIVDPMDPDNITFHLYLGHYDLEANDVWAIKQLPGNGIAPGETGTLYIRFMLTGPNNWALGTSDRPLQIDSTSGNQTVPGAWDDYNALIHTPAMGSLEHFVGGEFLTTYPEVTFEYYEWYEFWMVIQNTFSEVDGVFTSTGTCTVYVKGPDDPDPVLVQVGTDSPKESAEFHRAPLDEAGNPQPILWCMINNHFDGGLVPSRYDEWLADDIYFSKGENLTNPLSYAGYPADGSRDTDTGTFLGWLNVTQAPYIWSYSLNGWIYMEEPAAAAPGAWGYFFK